MGEAHVIWKSFTAGDAVGLNTGAGLVAYLPARWTASGIVIAGFLTGAGFMSGTRHISVLSVDCETE